MTGFFSDLADGNLKSTLMLVGNIRQHFEVRELMDKMDFKGD